jgi:hypothetical protein
MLADGDVVMASMVCVYSKPQTDGSVRSVTRTSRTESVNPIDSELKDTNETVVTETCPTEHHSCYTLWQYNPIDPTNASLYTILAKGMSHGLTYALNWLTNACVLWEQVVGIHRPTCRVKGNSAIRQ